MPITTHDPAPPTLLQKFRAITEGYLLQVAQQETMRAALGSEAAHAPKQGFVYKLLPIVFLPGFRLTPWPIKQRLLRLFFVHSTQRWPERPWERELPRE
ncbi:MAG: hypothetical protein ACJ8CR_33375 [Roseiflexaceae bacterium]